MACVCAAALSLSACGGGGDDDAQPADPKAPPAVPNPSAQSGNVNPSRQPATPAVPAPAASPAIAGAALTAERNDLTTARRVGVSGDRNSVISINGHNITVARPEFEDQNFGTLSDDGKTRTVTNGRNILSYVRFGFHTDFDGKQHHVFAVGDATPADKVPTDGDTYYIGLSTFAMGTNPAFRTGLSSFHVNFGEKMTAKSMATAASTRLRWAAPSTAMRSAASKTAWKCRGSSTAPQPNRWVASSRAPPPIFPVSTNRRR